MLETFFEKRFVLERFRASPVGSHIDGFATSLIAQGYSFQAGGSCLRHAVHLGRWMEPQDIVLAALDEAVIASFMRHLPDCDCDDERAGSHERALARLRVFRRYLQDVGVVARPTPTIVDDPLVTEFVTWMRQQRGASEQTVKAFSRVVRRLLALVGNDPGAYTVHALRKAVVALTEGHGDATAEQVATATRSFVRQLAVRGQCSIDLADGIPRPAQWTQTTLPKHLSSEDVEKLLATCDVSTATGLRDRAVMLLLARLGLRADDVLRLLLADVDWKAATVRLVGKGRHESRLPLPQEVGDALLAYIDRGRPRIVEEHLFLTARAPWAPIRNNSTIAQLVEKAIRRAGVDAPSFGSHVLRHSAATSMLRDGASLDGIASILRHRSIDTTVVYARVDQGLLGSVAQPWTTATPQPASSYPPPTPSAALKSVAQPWLLEVPSC
ncbi:MAG: tyrosine-type recombinase/integrase [Polyangiaceae bacterium]|nr:tyrosine-type recombinase/integrase [Myxococcales bacterium]